MPNIDAGHYFLTVLLPIRTDPVKIYGIVTTPMLALREWIAGLPTAHQSEACLPNCNSPFARNLRNHFARFAVIEVPAFNGRVQGDTLISKIRCIDPIVPQTNDRLTTPYLFLSADFNCIHGDERDLDSYLTTLWETMEPEIHELFQYCWGVETVSSAETFVAFIKRGQLETTMPFHDYWSEAERSQVPDIAPALKTGAAIAALAFAIVFIAALLIHMPVFCKLGVILIAATAIVYGLYRLVMIEGQKPLPAAHGADLPGVLKSLYLQKQFTRFAIDNQGADPAALRAAFSAFLQTHQPSHVAAPTQAPGVIGA